MMSRAAPAVKPALAKDLRREAVELTATWGVIDLVADSRPVRFPRNDLDAFNDVYALELSGHHNGRGHLGPRLSDQSL